MEHNQMNPKMLTSEAVGFLNVSIPAIHKNLKSKDLSHSKSKNKTHFGHQTAKGLFGLSFRPTCWSWQNLKGGVGKTNLAFATAVRLSLYGAKVAIIDLDQQGNMTQACGIHAEDKPILLDLIMGNNELKISDCMVPVIDGLDLLPSRIENAVLDNLFAINGLPVDRELKNRINILKKTYDFIFIDCPPSLGQVVAAASLAADFIVVPVDPEKFSLSGLNITLQELEKNVAKRFDTELNIRIVFNKFDGRTTLSREILTELYNNKKYGNKTFSTFIRSSQHFPNSIAKGETIFDSLQTTTAKEDIDLLAKEFIEETRIQKNHSSSEPEKQLIGS